MKKAVIGKDDQFSKKEAKDRFLRALKAAVNTPPKPLKARKAKAKKKRR